MSQKQYKNVSLKISMLIESGLQSALNLFCRMLKHTRYTIICRFYLIAGPEPCKLQVCQI